MFILCVGANHKEKRNWIKREAKKFLLNDKTIYKGELSSYKSFMSSSTVSDEEIKGMLTRLLYD